MSNSIVGQSQAVEGIQNILKRGDPLRCLPVSKGRTDAKFQSYFTPDKLHVFGQVIENY